jgi:GT2 family glycosyltransferase
MDTEKKRIEIDVIILSYAENSNLKTITENCLDSLMASEDPEIIQFNVIVIESEKKMKPEQYSYGLTVYPEQEFGYHTYMNIGLGLTSAAFVCLCNNDLVFHTGWATEILKAFLQDRELSSASPFCSFHHPTMGFQANTGVYPGYRIRYEISGWCLFLKRDVLRITGKLDESFKFWCADNDYANTLSVLNLKHALVSSSIVDHLETQTLNEQNEKRQDELMAKTDFYYEKKWLYRFGEGWVSLD